MDPPRRTLGGPPRACGVTAGGGINSVTWLVEQDGHRYVAKHIAPEGLDALACGCQIAAELADAGLRTGRPVRAWFGDLVFAEARLALLERVPGRPLDRRTAEDQQAMATTLAQVHRLGQPEPGPGTRRPAKPLGVER
ncbi:phosphotransferase [Promicromonospora sukumoe]|uniref:phosphotransferase n=1 Tax=Promicromonospora sukumoe TaxID=88382 RepID=UPI0036656846